MSSTGLRALLLAVKQVRQFNRGDLRLVLARGAFEEAEELMRRGRIYGASESVKIAGAFILAGLRYVFQNFDTVDAAVGSFT